MSGARNAVGFLGRSEKAFTVFRRNRHERTQSIKREAGSVMRMKPR